MGNVLPSQFEDKQFATEYVSRCSDGNELSKHLQEDDVTINSLQLIVDLTKWLREAEGSKSAKVTAASTAKSSVDSVEAARKHTADKKKEAAKTAAKANK